MDALLPGQRVRIKTDPGRIGVVTDRSTSRRGLLHQQVQFPEAAQYIPIDQIEAVSDDGDDPIDLLTRGRLAGPADLRRTLTFARLTGRIADVIYSMDMTGADFYAYQFKPLVKLMNAATTGLLIADEVGLGKTIEAGLIWTELRSRFDFRRLLIVCPPMLREKWKTEMRQRFGLEAEIVDAADLHEKLARGVDDGESSPFVLIISLPGIRPPRGYQEVEPSSLEPAALRLARLLESQRFERPLVDLTVIDEAHYMRNPETMSAAAGRLLRDVSEYVLLLSATPVHLRSEDLYQLVRLADPDTFARREDFDDLLNANEPLVRARDLVVSGTATAETLRELLSIAAGNPLLEGSQQLAALVSSLPTDDELQDPTVIGNLAYRLETVNLLGHVVTRTRKREVKEWQVVREAVPEEVPLSEPEREFYENVTKIVRDYCARAGGHEGFLLVTPQRQMTSSMAAALNGWKGRRLQINLQLYEDLGEDEEQEDDQQEMGPLVREIVEKVSEIGDEDLLRKFDSKYARLRDRLKEFYSREPAEKVVLFSAPLPEV